MQLRKNIIVSWTVSLLLVMSIQPLFDVPAQARTLRQKYPRIANYYLTPTVSEKDAEQLAGWDIVILGTELQYTSPEVFATLRKKNPDIIILAYVPSEEVPVKDADITDPLHPHYQLLHGVDESWWLTDHAGNQASYWPGTRMLNVTNNAPLVNGQRWNTYLPNVVHTTVMTTGLWDGIFYDNVWPNISWVNNGDIDTDRNGVADSAATVDTAWRTGMQTLLDTSRGLEGKDAIIIGNGGGDYFTATNGRLIEDFPSAGDGGWSGAMQKYFDVLQRGSKPSVVIVNGKSSDGTANDKQSLRFDLASTLLGDGYLSFDVGSQKHSDLWWYDEYTAYLGNPLGAARNLSNTGTKAGTAGVWWRNFEDGIVLVNATGKLQTLDLQDGYAVVGAAATSEKFVSTVKLPAHDGVLLLKRQFVMSEGQFLNGSFTRSFFANGIGARQGFFVHDTSRPIGVTVAHTTNPQTLTVSTQGNRIRVQDSARKTIANFAPFGTSTKGELHIAVGDLNGDGTEEIVVALGTGSLPRIRVFSIRGHLLMPEIKAFPGTTPFGLNIAVGDVDGDGKQEIVAAPDAGGGPQISIFSSKGKLLRRFFAYDIHFRGGVRLATGDLNGNGIADIITVPGKGKVATVRVLDGRGKAVHKNFLAFPKTFLGGTFVTVADTNGDHTPEILVSAPDIL